MSVGMNKYVLKESPLVMVLVDLRFSQLPKNNLNAGLEKFKSSLFSLGLSVQNESDVKQVRATSNANSPIDIKEIITKRWDFINIDKNKGVILTDGSLCFRTTTYENFEGFKEFWRGIVDAIGQIKKKRLRDIAINQQMVSMGEESKFWGCVANALY